MSPLRSDKRRVLFVIGAAGSFVANTALAATQIVNGGTPIEGSGKIAEETRSVSGYSRLVLSGPMDVQLKHTGAEKAVVRADDNIVRLIDTRVEGGKLIVEAKQGASFRTRNKILVLVDFKQLDAVLLHGSGDVLADDIKAGIFEGTIKGSGNMKIGKLDADTVAISIAGSGNFDARGRAGKVGVVIEGSGDVRVEDLQAKSAAVRIAGSGDTLVNASESLQARIAGSGNVRYRGNPQVEKKVEGSGSVTPLR
jgi:hypothetical protein